MGNGSETWYRGEGVGVERAKPGSVPNDLGDGYYVADSVSSAKAYAALRAPDAADQRVFSVKIDRSSLRVLDLTKNPAWQQHVRPVEPLIKQANENYGRSFANFLKANKIDLGQYDAVIGLDYVRGGRQMNILLKAGKPSPLEVSIRGRLQPLTPATVRARVATPIDLDEIPVRVVGGPRAEFMATAAETAITAGIVIILAALEIWMTRRMQKDEIAKGLKDLEPKIADRLNKLKPDIAKSQLVADKGEKVFANIVVQIHFIPYSMGAGRGGYVKPDVRLADINITLRNVTSERHFELTLDEEDTPRVRRPVDEYTHSVEVQVYTGEELDLFEEWSAQYLEYSRKRGMDPANQAYIAELRRLRELIVRTFGTEIWYLGLPFGG